jgi:hypothetical protein
MRIKKISAACLDPLDLKAFSQELRKLSDRYGVRLISVGAMATVETAGKGATYIALWSTEPNENQGD